MTSQQTPAIVSAERKRELLLQAWRDRVAWIDSGSFQPWADANKWNVAQGTSSDDDDCHEEEEGHTIHPGILALESSHACQRMESALPIIKSLYGLSGEQDMDKAKGSGLRRCDGLTQAEAGKRILDVLEKNFTMEERQNIFNNYSSSKEESMNQNGTNSFEYNSDILKQSYMNMMEKLKRPQSAESVQGMRHFVRSFNEATENLTKKYLDEKAEKDRKANRDSDEEKDADHNMSNDGINGLVSSMHKYLEKLHLNMKSDKASVGTTSSDTDNSTSMTEMDQYVLDIFIYDKCHDAIYHYFDSTGFEVMNKAWTERIDSIQFVGPTHLELECFTDDSWKQHLSKPIQHLRALQRQYSPKQMLSCILQVYRSINEALSTAMNTMSKGDKLPSADDVLPTLILCTICVKPPKILSILRFIECFATDDEMRGEHAYAYTNLYSAVEFIRELDLNVSTSSLSEDVDDKRPSLSISKEDLREHLEKHRQERQEKEKRKSTMKTVVADTNDMSDGEDPVFPTPKSIHIPISEVRAARLRGEDLMEWAQSWYEKNSALYDGTSTLDERAAKATKATSTNPRLANFSRSYTYLSTDPNDVRMSDIPPLLNEYRSLVYAAEELLHERTTRFQEEYKREVMERRELLEKNAVEVNAFGKDGEK